MLRLLTSFAAAGAVLPAAEAILVAPDSPCSTNCGNVLDSTAPDDLVCTPGQYTGGYNNNAGTVFQGCVQCELESGYVTKNNYSDNEAALYNLRYAVSYCVFNEPSHYDFVNNPCVTSKACGVFANAIAYQNLSVTSDDYGYCDTWPTGDSVDFHGCIECLQVNNNYLANFVTVLQAGCEQKPMDGLTLGLHGNIFSSDVVNITEPTPTAKVDPAWFDHGPLGLGGKVGVAVAGFILLLTLAGVFVVCRGRRRRKAFLRKLQTNMPPMKSNPGGWPSMSTNPHDSNETPISQRPLRNWDDSPMTANTEKTFPRYFSPYSSQFNSPISATDVNHMPWPEPAHGSPHSPREIGLALGSAIDINSPSHERWVSSPDDKGKMKEEAYEMQYVDSAGSGIVAKKRPIHVEAPILAHPGYGRNSDSPPRQYDVNGNAVQGDMYAN